MMRDGRWYRQKGLMERDAQIDSSWFLCVAHCFVRFQEDLLSRVDLCAMHHDDVVILLDTPSMSNDQKLSERALLYYCCTICQCQ
jgi:hypothetical protein